MKTISAYNVEHVSGHVAGELKRLRAQVDLFWDKEYRQLLEFGLKDGMRIVEFGCGPGFMSTRLLENLPEIRLVGVEPDPVLVPEFQKNLAPQALERTRYVCGSIITADLEENCFDFAITRLVLEHVPDPLAALAKIRRVLKPGGHAVLIDNDFGFHLRTSPEIPELAELYDAYCRCRVDEGGNPTIGRELPTLLQAAGFDQVDLELITAHSRLIGDDIFFASEGSGIPFQLVKKGYLSRAAMGSIMQKWRDMVRHDGHIIFRQLFAAVGRKAPESCCIAEATSASAYEHASPVEILPGVALEQITAIAAGLLQIPAETLPVTEHFIDLGLGSIETVELIERLNKKLGIQLDISAVFDFPSIDELARHITACHQVDGARLNPATKVSGKEKATQAAGPGPKPPPAYVAPSGQAPAVCIQAEDSGILSEDIAVIGMSGRFASAESVHEYWDLLIGGRCAIKEIDRPGWNPEDFYNPDVSKENKANSKWGGLLGDISGFDPRFFKIPPREAEFMDPQQRLFLMEGYKALEDSGYTSGMLSDSRTAVFVGVRPSDYLRLAISRGGVNSQSFLGNDNSILASRISYCLNLNGPSLAIDTACSSSLVAVHLACESIRRGESDMALAGGVFVMSSPEFYQLASKTTMLSPKGLCKTFDDTADGIVPGEAVAAVILKPLDQAVADGDRIYGVIKASAVNQDGKTNGITAPRMISQKELLRRLYRASGIDPETISFIETHGTGTKLGDPIEFKALAEVFGEFTAKKGYCLLGSHKPNIGHSITAAGISGLIKILLSLNHRQIPATISLDNINRHIRLDATPFAVNSQACSWTSGNGGPLRAGISSFGFNGTNCHMIIEQAPAESRSGKSWDRPGCLVPLSAKNPEALRRRLAELARWMEADGSRQHLSDIAFTLSLRRDHFNQRMIVAAVDTTDFKQRLKALVRGSQQDESLPASVPSDFHSVWPENPTAAAMEHLAGDYIAGNPVDWEALYDKTSCRLVGVPAYPFSRQPYWLPEAEDPKGRVRIVPRQETSGGDRGGEPIAIIGMAAVLPQSRDLESFHAHILAQKSLVTEIPPSRWDWRRYFGDAARQPNKTTVKWGAFVPDVYQFDARFFGISRREAELMDPQQRLLLETVWSCMENAGTTATALSGSATGFFLGISNMDYFGMATHPDMPIEAYSSTGTTHSIAANRVSYFLNLHGPNESIDTACSSSLVAAHRAVTSLRRGECEMAFVAGVNVMLNPVLHLSFSRAGMLSTQGQCKTFDASADGYVRGEGAAVILLKPLSRAIEDRDPIHALIRGSAVNHGGWANSLTAPNPKAQTDLIVQAYRNAGVDPATIGYIEAHGTGTSLGDPVEVNGLIAAFTQLYEQWRHPLPEKPTCKVGSVKTMIGHLEAAAGISGLLHVVLAMQHGRLPGNIHLNKVNPYIRLERSPFAFARNPEPWNRFRAPDNREIPLRAGVSAFGFGGANAHVVLEEYLSTTAASILTSTGLTSTGLTSTGPTSTGPASTGSIVVPLSARDQGALRQYARRLADFLTSGNTVVDLNDVAYTLQTGREPMAERLAVVAHDLPELAQTLQHYAQGHCDRDNLFCGRVKQTRRGKSAGNAPAADQAGLEIAVRNGNLDEPARLWVQGGEIPWRVFYNDPGPRRIPLPTYPFQRQMYRIPQVGWISRSGSRSSTFADPSGAHPLIDGRHDGQEGHVYVKTLQANEFYLNDHRVGDTPVLPGAAYLEMAREAASRTCNGLPVRAIRDVVWSAPIIVNDGAVTLRMQLRTEDQHTVFEAVTVSPDGSTRSHAQGRLFFDDAAQGAGRAETLDIAEIQRRCDDVLTTDQCYQVFSRCGLNYGPGFQSIRELRRNSAEALACIELPAHLDTGSRDFGLHPSLLDGLLQTVLGVLQLEVGGETMQYLPFGLGDLEIRGAMPRKGYGYAVPAGQLPDSSPLRKFDLHFVDEQGRTILIASDFTVKRIARPTGERPLKKNNRMYFQRQWHLLPVTDADQGNPWPHHLLVFDSEWDSKGDSEGDLFEDFSRSLTSHVTVVRPGTAFHREATDIFRINPVSGDDYLSLCRILEQENRWPQGIVYRWPAMGAVLDGQRPHVALDQGVNALLLLSQALVAVDSRRAVRLLYIDSVEDGAARAAHDALGAFMGTLRQEHPSLQYKSIAVRLRPDESLTPKQVRTIAGNEFRTADEEYRLLYKDDLRYVGGYRAFRPAQGRSDAPAFIPRGVYLITGGLGALGRSIARHLASACQARLVLVGRRGLQAVDREWMAALEAGGAEVIYVQADISIFDDVQAVVRKAGERFQTVNGVIHAAGLIRDAFVRNKTLADMQAVMAPKIQGTLNLDQALGNAPLDFFMLFSSISAVAGNVGQCDYAYANAFMDAYARQRERLRSQGRRHGKTLSINWPLWREGGMIIDERIEKMLETSMGMTPLDTADGLALLEEGLASDETCYGVVDGDVLRLQQTLGITDTQPPDEIPARGPEPAPLMGENMNEPLAEDIRAMAGSILKVETEDVDIDESLAEYGFDSITFTELANTVNERYGVNVTPPVFFEHTAIESFAAYLMQTFPAEMQKHFTAGQPYSNPVPPAAADPGGTLSVAGSRARSSGASAAGENRSSLPAVMEELKQIVGRILRVPPDEIDTDESLAEYGFDSITFTELANTVNERYGINVTPPVFFEHTAIESFATYLMQTYSDAVGPDAAGPDVMAGQTAAERAQTVHPLDQPSDCAPYDPVGDRSGADESLGVEPPAAEEQAHSHNVISRSESKGVPSEPRGVLSRDPLTPAVAIIGMSGRLPGAENPDAFWQHLAAGRDLIREVPADRWDWRAIYGDPRQPGNKTNSKWGGFMENVDCFDADFFSISPLEAECMDPQHRIFLETVWQTIEDAGYNPDGLAGSNTGLFVGIGNFDYGLMYRERNIEIEPHAAVGLAHCMIANRISYLLDLHGPSEPVDTACSSSLVAIHRAVEAIRRGECQLAIAGGVNLMLLPTLHVAFGKSGMLSPDGRCKTFDRNADGYVRGEGVGAVLLKPLGRAVADKDHIYAVIRATSINHGGHASSLAAPNPKAQADLIVDSFGKAGIDPASVTYIEAHGTGTALGDPVEINGLKTAFRTLFDRRGQTPPAAPFCGLGSVKTNIGHLETAAGIASVLKVLLSIKHRTLPASLHLKALNPYIDLTDSPFYIVSEKRPWASLYDENGLPIPRRAGVSSFGFGGVNAHVVLEEYTPEEVDAGRGPDAAAIPGEQLFVLSAGTRQQLKTYAERLADYLARQQNRHEEAVSLRDIAFTLQTGRPALTERLAVVAGDVDRLIRGLETFARDRGLLQGVYCGRPPKKAPLSPAAGWSGNTGTAPAAVIQGQALDELARRWIAGEALEWNGLYSGVAPGRVSLPTYPFERRSCWLSRTDDVPAVAAVVQNKIPADDVPAADPAPAPGARDHALPSGRLVDRTADHLAGVLARVTKQSVEKINPRTPFENIGIDSLTTLKLTHELEKHFGKLSKTLFFEHGNIRELAAFLATQYRSTLERLFQMETDTEPSTITGPSDTAATAGTASPVVQVEKPQPDQQATEGVCAGTREDIAIVGLSGRYPGARDLDQFWENLCAGKDCITEIPPDRWELEGFFDPSPGAPGRSYCKWGGFIDDVDKFDPLFFNITPKEAEFMEPQERLFLQTAWEAFEDAGYTRAGLQGLQVGVFAGVMYGQYQLWEAEMDGRRVAPGSFFAAVANRVSYHFDLSGPSIALDTMCSSSLTAIHLACESIRRGESDMALCGGVNLSIHPNKYTFLSLGRFVSSDGRCRSFGRDGDGYVPGEGVGAVVLKPLRRALADQDHIYGLIKGSALNHGGKTSGFSVPNPNAQGDLIRRAMAQAGVHPRTVSYVEAHGTGTALGDPIEISGLEKCFGNGTAQKQYCPIGSVKSNIGHLEAAAGIAALTKVLLQMKHGVLVPSIHSRELNPNIDFNQSSFYVQRELTPWERPHVAVDGPAREFPRRAGISAFGAGGANAHLIVEEFDGQGGASTSRPAAESYGPQLVVLSAATPEALDQVVDRLSAFLKRKDVDGDRAPHPVELRDLAYTLQVGREAQKERLAFIVSHTREFMERLEQYRNGTMSDPSGVFRKNGHAVVPELDSLLTSPEGREFIHSLMNGGKLEALARLWITGVDIQWSHLYAGEKPRRIALPMYPFARERCWLAASALPREVPSAAPVADSLVLRNISTFQRECFETIFAGEGVWFTDHCIAGRKILPGAVLLEMTRAAARLAGDQLVAGFENVQWLKGIMPGDPDVSVLTCLHPTEKGALFRIHTGIGEDEKPPHVRGELVFAPDGTQPPDRTVMDLSAIRRRCATQWPKERCYEMFGAAGMTYGPAFQSIRTLFFNDAEALAHLELPRPWASFHQDWILHPALLDGAFQAVLGLLAPPWSAPQAVMVPVELKKLEIAAAIPSHCFAHVTRADSRQRPDDGLVFDVTMLDENGNVVVRMTRLHLRELTGLAPAADRPQTALCRMAWKNSDPEDDILGEDLSRTAEALKDKILMVFDGPSDYTAGIRKMLAGGSATPRRIIRVLPGAKYQRQDETTWMVDPKSQADFMRLVEAQPSSPHAILFLWGLDPADRDAQAGPGRLDGGYYAALYLARSLMKHHGSIPLSLVFAYPWDDTAAFPEYAAMVGLAKTIRLEDPLFEFQTLALDPENAGPAQACPILLREITFHHDAPEVRYRNGRRQVNRLQPLMPSPVDSESIASNSSNTHGLLKTQGVYVIAGGGGGLGLILAEHLAQHYQARLVLAGRSVPDDRLEGVIASLEALGAKVLYVQADVAKAEDTHNLIGETKAYFGRVDGVIHGAGLLRDSLIFNKSLGDVHAVLAPKIDGALNLDRACREEPLDFFVLFSSLAAVTGNVGQCDYAFANAFLDAFALRREYLRGLGRRSGVSVSINWPLWQSGKMRANEQAKIFLEKTLGLVPMPSPQGLTAFEACLGAGHPQIIVIHGDTTKAVNTLNKRILAPDRAERCSVAGSPEDAAPEEIEAYLVSELSREAKLPREKIDPAVSLEQYGIDSIIIMNMISRMETVFGALPKTLFYEYQTLRDLARYLAGHYPPRHALPGGPVSQTDRPHASEAAPQASTAPVARRFTTLHRGQAVSGTRPQAGDIAIIGLAGRYPRAADPGALWANLCEGMDGISEVPAMRWNHARYFDPDRERDGKTYSKWGGFMDDIDKFDALFFNIAPREAALLDPQERLFLETAWALMEDAGYTRSRLAGYSTGVFVGVMWGHYQQMVQGVENATTPPSSSFASIANRVSYFLNLQGPSMAVDTMCSSSLTAIHLAIDSIRKGESRMAIAGGVNLTVHPNKYLLLSRTGFLSSDGRCRSFGSGGDGYVPGEGVGAVLLKSLDHALADSDHIYAVIKSSVVNHGGKTNGYTVPNPGAQAQVIRGALDAAGMDPRTITYIEAHGTGTVLGDPIEIAGLSQAFKSPDVSSEVSPQRFDDRTSPWCAIGSIKSNIGHLEAAAGIAGLTKILLQMQHRRLVPSLHAETLNPNLALAKSPFKIQRHLTEWHPAVVDQQVFPLRAGLSSFGAGGSNAHLLVEAYTDRTNRDRREPDQSRIIVLSAKTGERLLAYARKFKGFLDDFAEPSPSLADLAYTLQIGREPMESRLALIARDMPSLRARLEEFIEFLNATSRTTPAPGGIFTNVIGADSRPGEPVPVSSGFFTEDDLGQVVADVLVRSRDLNKIAQAWVSGFDIDWTALYPDSDEDPAPRVISLPTYPFDPVRHWFSPPVAESHGELRESEPSPAPAQDPGPTPAQCRPGAIDDPQPEEVRDFVVHIISKELHIPKPQIDPRKDLKEYGLESIGALRLINQLNRRYGCEIPTEVFMRVSVRSLAAAVTGADDVGGGVVESAREPGGTEMFPEIRRMSPSLDIGTVLLNGATGVLGACLLKDILKTTSCEVVCLVRAGEAGSAAERLRTFLKVYDPQGRLDDAFDARVIPMAGDITQPYLGLGRREYEALTGKVDLVIHNAAKTSLHGVYSELEEVNVRGTRTMIEFARATARQYLVFISSYTVFGDRVAQKTRPFTENDLDVGQGFEHLGYPRTKYEAERLVRAAHGRGLRWIIIRPGNIMGDSRTGAYPFGLARTPGIFYDLLKTVIDLKTAPLSPQLFDITPVDYVSRGIIHLCLERQEMFSTYHLLNPQPNSFEQIVGLLNRVGYPVTLIDRDAFLENIRTVRGDYHSLSAELMRFNPAFVPNRENTPVSSELTRAVLSSAGIDCPPVDEQLLATYVDYCTRNGVLPPAAEQYREPQDGVASTQMLIGG